MSALSFRPAGIGAIRLLSTMAIFAFTSFIAVDPFMVEGSIASLVQVRIVWILGACLLLGSTWTRIALRHATPIGMVLCVWTGSGVVLLTEMTGGASSPYWTMVMLTFFTVALILPMKAWQAALSFGSVALFYYAWMVGHDATGTSYTWVSSNAGIWLAALVSVWAVSFLDRLRTRDSQHRHSLESLNEQLRAEIAERERIQKAALRTQQLDAVGQLASGLAHELNNLLMVISGAAECLERDPSSSTKNTQRIIQSAHRGGRLTSDLLLFAREGSREDEPFSVDQMVKDVAELVQSSHRGRIDVRYDSPGETSWVKGDVQLLGQVMLNLCLNSIDAMSGKGTLQLVNHSTSSAADKGDAALGWVQIEVIDHGQGMDAISLQRAFEPFFTTKAPGEGTGLGLSMAYGTIQDHNGTLELESVVGQGTRAVIKLPRIQAPVAAVRSKEPEKCPDLSPGSVLLVDDDPMVREVMQETLQSFGFQVIPTRDGADALTHFQNADPSPGLVILDMMMPVMGGAETFIRLRQLQPDVPILVYSGFPLEQPTIDSFSGERWRFLRKPFTNEELQEVVSQLVASSATKKIT
jgi:signal transduction histidine kinase/CheY-like chemotaxis protein